MAGKRRSIGLSRIRGVGLLPELLEAGAGEQGLLRAFKAAGLPIQTLENRDLPIPISSMAELFAHAGAILDDRALGFTVGRNTTHLGWGKWTGYGSQAPTLLAGLNRINATRWAHMSDFEMTLAREGGEWVWRVVPPLRHERIMHYSDHLVYPMLTYVQTYLGKDWRPDWVEVNYLRDRDARLIENMVQAPLRCGGRGIALSFSEEELTRPHPSAHLPASEALTLTDIISDVTMPEAKEPARSFSAIVSMRLLDGKSDIEGAARLAGFSVQGLQRRLRTAGYTYSEILEMTRRRRALSLLTDTRVPVSEIAYSLGYDEHANFSRAFQRWMGCSPTAYRGQFSVDREAVFPAD